MTISMNIDSYLYLIDYSQNTQNKCHSVFCEYQVPKCDRKKRVLGENPRNADIRRERRILPNKYRRNLRNTMWPGVFTNKVKNFSVGNTRQDEIYCSRKRGVADDVTRDDFHWDTYE